MDEFQKILADRLFARGAVRLGDQASPPGISIDLQGSPRGVLTEGDIDAISAELACMIRERAAPQFFDLVAGVPCSSEPFAKAVAYLSDKSLLTISKGVEGKYSPGQRVLLVGGQLARAAEEEKEAIGIAKKAGLNVAGLAVLIDLQRGGGKALRSLKCHTMAAFTLEDLLGHYVRTGKVSQAERAGAMPAKR